MAHLAQAERQDLVAAERQDLVALEHRVLSPVSRLPEGQAQEVVVVAVLALPEPSVKVARRVSRESQSAPNARNLNKEKHRA